MMANRCKKEEEKCDCKNAIVLSHQFTLSRLRLTPEHLQRSANKKRNETKRFSPKLLAVKWYSRHSLSLKLNVRNKIDKQAPKCHDIFCLAHLFDVKSIACVLFLFLILVRLSATGLFYRFPRGNYFADVVRWRICLIAGCYSIAWFILAFLCGRHRIAICLLAVQRWFARRLVAIVSYRFVLQITFLNKNQSISKSSENSWYVNRISRLLIWPVALDKPFSWFCIFLFSTLQQQIARHVLSAFDFDWLHLFFEALIKNCTHARSNESTNTAFSLEVNTQVCRLLRMISSSFCLAN